MTSSAEKIRRAMIARVRAKGIEIPGWIPERLTVEFCDCALAHGEEHAASYIRKRKKELDDEWRASNRR